LAVPGDVVAYGEFAVSVLAIVAAFVNAGRVLQRVDGLEEKLQKLEADMDEDFKGVEKLALERKGDMRSQIEGLAKEINDVRGQISMIRMPRKGGL
jgi:hypothetical protein